METVALLVARASKAISSFETLFMTSRIVQVSVILAVVAVILGWYLYQSKLGLTQLLLRGTALPSRL